MKVYWKKDGEKIGNDEFGNAIYEQMEQSGTLVGPYHTIHSGYPYLLIALDNGRFTSIRSNMCYHKEIKKNINKRI